MVQSPTPPVKKAPRAVQSLPTIPESEVKAMIEETFGPGHIMLYVALNESQMNPSAKNPRSSASGVFQITNATFQGCPGSVFNAADNIACAKKIYDRRGLQPWEASRNHGFAGGWGKNL